MSEEAMGRPGKGLGAVKAIAPLTKGINCLRARAEIVNKLSVETADTLNPVLSPATPEKVVSGPTTEPPQGNSTMADEFRNVESILTESISRMEDILRRSEV